MKLYFLAKDVLKEAVHISVTVQPGMTVSLFRNPAHFDLNASQSSVGAGAIECMKPSTSDGDALFEQFENWLRHGVAAVLDGVSRIDTMDKQRTATFLGKIANLKSTISQLLDFYGTNPLAITRLEGIELNEIQQLLRTVEAKWVDQGHASGRVVRLSLAYHQSGGAKLHQSPTTAPTIRRLLSDPPTMMVPARCLHLSWSIVAREDDGWHAPPREIGSEVITGAILQRVMEDRGVRSACLQPCLHLRACREGPATEYPASRKLS